jgi:hypothetical protein
MITNSDAFITKKELSYLSGKAAHLNNKFRKTKNMTNAAI